MDKNMFKSQDAPIKVQPQYLTLLLMLYVTFSLIGCAVLYKIIKIDFVVGPGGILSLPFVLLMEDIIAEVYGYKISRILLWYILISQLIFTYFILMVIHLHSPSYWHIQNAYNEVFGGLGKGTTTMVVAIFIGRFTNLYVITKLKIFFKGKLFWVRSVLSSFCGDLLTLTILYTIAFSSLTFGEMSHLYLSDLFTRVLYSIIGGGPALLVVMYLKKKENIDVYDYGTNFNPFRFSLKVKKDQ